MEINLLKQQVEAAIGVTLKESEMGMKEWNLLVRAIDSDPAELLKVNGKYVWLYKKNNASSTAHFFEVDQTLLTDTEAKLIGLLLVRARESVKGHTAKKDDESRSLQLGEWIQERMDLGELQGTVPEHFALKPKLQGSFLPFMLSWENRAGHEVVYTKLYKLLKSYFGGDLLLIPLKDSWLILVSEALLTELREESEEGTDAERDMLHALCQGLYELIANEWMGSGCHLSVHELITGESRLLETAVTLYESLLIGRLFHVSEYIHLPWELRLERFIYSIPEPERERFIMETGRHSGIFTDEEVLLTLETFFEMDCNISETAKRLYIHRNTLMYRIDKIKQETGLDVRAFQDAVLMNLLLLLYKVTK